MNGFEYLEEIIQDLYLLFDREVQVVPRKIIFKDVKHGQKVFNNGYMLKSFHFLFHNSGNLNLNEPVTISSNMVYIMFFRIFLILEQTFFMQAISLCF